MFNKIVASVISSVVLFACNLKEETPVASEDAVANSVAAEVVASEPSPATPLVSDPATPSVPEVTATPLTASGVSAGSTVSTPSAGSTSAPVTGTVAAPAGLSVVDPATSVLVK